MPTLNEEQGVGECITKAKEALAEMEVYGEIILSDSSSDRTPEIGRAEGAIVVKPDRRGYGYAYEYGIERARGKFIAMADADTTYDFTELPKLFAPVATGEADIVLGSRFAGRIEPGAMPWLHKRIGNPFLTWFLNFFYKAGVSDAHSGFRVFTKRAYDRLNLRSSGMEFASEMVMAAGAMGLKIEEVPITYHPRKGEAKLESFHDGWRHVKFMLTNAPNYLFAVPALGFSALGLMMMFGSLLSFGGDGGTLSTYTAVAGSMLTILGFQTGSLALFSSVALAPIREPRDPVSMYIRANFSLERGTAAGLVLYILGASYLSLELINWPLTRTSAPEPAAAVLLAATAVVLGGQTVFSSFFLSMLRGEQNRLTEPTFLRDRAETPYVSSED
ncbi:glycosyltransferase family 2 protein [Halobium salinum]|uniref:Glycosyltransferase family 2 protein n=2 Tax=Halobium salinum TaxID=1364940 RepID=A0ABD5PB63_9EURY|nr:glycosyltransferase family 2 protein [Halobium salinum]